MTGGRAFLYDPSGRHVAALDVRSVAAVRLGAAMADRPDGPARMDDLVRLLEGQRAAGSQLAEGLLRDADLGASFWLVEPIVQPATVDAATGAENGATGRPAVAGSAPQPDRNAAVPVSAPTPEHGVPTMDRTWGRVTPG
jgi:hypothetical protein